MKVVIAYEEGGDEALHMKTKMTVPKSWRAGPVSKLLDFAVETYNGKHPAAPQLEAGAVHFEKAGSSVRLGLEDVVEAVLDKSDALVIKPGASARLGDAAQAVADAEAARVAALKQKMRDEAGKVRCKNFGCTKFFDVNDNPADACAHHTGPPFFHDCRKGWTCCKEKKSAMDWDEFNALPTCALGPHSAEAPKAPAPQQGGEDGPAPVAAKPALASIDGFNASAAGQVAASTAKSVAATMTKPKVVKYDDGTFRCQNKGCAVKFDPTKNPPSACSYHAAAPIFHETYKWWSCCPHAKKAEFDDFMAVPGCRHGSHWNGEGDAPAGSTTPPAEGEGVVEVGDDGFDLG